MAAKKTVDQLVKEMQDNITAMSNKYVAVCLEVEDGEFKEQKEQEKADLKKRLASLKSELKFIQSMAGKVDKKSEKELKKQQDDIINWVKKMPSSIGDIVKTIPKH